MTKEQFLTELIGECYHDPIHIATRNTHGVKGRIQIRRVCKCSKCKVILIKTEYEGLVPFKIALEPSFTLLDFESWEVFGKLLKFAQTSGINPLSPYKGFWEQFCLEVGGVLIDEVATLPKSHISPYVFANSLVAFLLRHPELIKEKDDD